MSACAESGAVPMGGDGTDEPAESDVGTTEVDEADEAEEADEDDKDDALPPAAFVSPLLMKFGKDAPFVAAASQVLLPTAPDRSAGVAILPRAGGVDKPDDDEPDESPALAAADEPDESPALAAAAAGGGSGGGQSGGGQSGDCGESEELGKRGRAPTDCKRGRGRGCGQSHDCSKSEEHGRREGGGRAPTESKGGGGGAPPPKSLGCGGDCSGTREFEGGGGSGFPAPIPTPSKPI